MRFMVGSFALLTAYMRTAGAAGHRAGDGGEAGGAAPGADAAHRAEAQHRRPCAQVHWIWKVSHLWFKSTVAFATQTERVHLRLGLVFLPPAVDVLSPLLSWVPRLHLSTPGWH